MGSGTSKKAKRKWARRMRSTLQKRKEPVKVNTRDKKITSAAAGELDDKQLTIPQGVEKHSIGWRYKGRFYSKEFVPEEVPSIDGQIGKTRGHYLVDSVDNKFYVAVEPGGCAISLPILRGGGNQRTSDRRRIIDYIPGRI